MKAAVGIIFLMLTLYQAEALRCNFCFSGGTELCESTSIQTCSPTQDACGAVIIQYPISRSFRQCMNMAVCQGFIGTPGSVANCCSTELCN